MECISGGAPCYDKASPSLQSPSLNQPRWVPGLPGLDTGDLRRSHRALESKFQSSWIKYKSPKFCDPFVLLF